jgi:mersacidin/lichenicidin family type 2 lantibiotic
MSTANIIRAWKSPAYRNTLSATELASLPANPAGAIELTEADLGEVSGGIFTLPVCTRICSRFSCDCSTAWPHGLPC